MTSAMDLFAEGNIFPALLNPFTATIGTELFFGLVFLTGITLIYMKSKSPGLVAIAIMISSTSMLPYVDPRLQGYLITLIALSLTYTIYKFYFEGRN